MKIILGRWTLIATLENSESKLTRRLQQLVADGLTIQAIKEHRAAHGSTLKEAHEFVRALPKIPNFMSHQD